jgi:hypothetical protein
MSSCPNVHEHPEFKASYDTTNKNQVREVAKWTRMLKSPSGHFVGEYLKHDLAGFKSAPKGRNAIKTLFILCKDCKKEIIRPNCSFCGSNEHSINDAVLLYIGEHDETYKEGKRRILQLKAPPSTQQPDKTIEYPQI